MRKLLFFLKAYPISLRAELLFLFAIEPLRAARLSKFFFHDYVIESRSILGFIYGRHGTAKPQKEGMLVQFPLNKVGITLLLRWNSSDFLVFNQVFVKEEYKPLTDLTADNPIIVDAGSNIGCTSIYLSAFYPEATIIALEPDPNNFKLLEKNVLLGKLKNVRCLQVALWYTDGAVSMTNNHIDKRNWSLKVVEEGPRNVEGKTLRKILADLNVTYIDILKMDIEGAEELIFERDHSIMLVLHGVKRVAIEVHADDSRVPDKIRSLNRAMETEGETLFVRATEM